MKQQLQTAHATLAEYTNKKTSITTSAAPQSNVSAEHIIQQIHDDYTSQLSEKDYEINSINTHLVSCSSVNRYIS